jgi:plasmid stabilization system protein ParE
VANAILAAGNSLNTFPRRGRPVGNTKMREILTLYPYVIRYRLSGNTVFILRIRHNARRPTTP